MLASPQDGRGLEGECSLDPIQELRSKGVISVAEGCIDGVNTTEMVKIMLGSRSLPVNNTVRNYEIVLLLDSKEEAVHLLTVDSFTKWCLSYDVRRWKPMGAKEELDWMQKKERIIKVLGPKTYLPNISLSISL